ncbi:MAG: hypothetical protein AAGL08_13880 [Cyanobacteria bacterium J06573_11]
MPLVTNPEPEPIKLPNFGDFQLAMLGNATYQRVSDRSANKLAVTRIETFFAQAADTWPAAAMLWRQMVDSCIDEVKPSAAEIEAWSAIAQATNMPIIFDEKGYLQPIEQE